MGRTVKGRRWSPRTASRRATISTASTECSRAGAQAGGRKLRRPRAGARCRQGRRRHRLDAVRDAGARRDAGRARTQCGQSDHGQGVALADFTMIRASTATSPGHSERRDGGDRSERRAAVHPAGVIRSRSGRTARRQRRLPRGKSKWRPGALAHRQEFDREHAQPQRHVQRQRHDDAASANFTSGRVGHLQELVEDVGAVERADSAQMNGQKHGKRDSGQTVQERGEKAGCLCEARIIRAAPPAADRPQPPRESPARAARTRAAPAPHRSNGGGNGVHSRSTLRKPIGACTATARTNRT